MKGGGIVPEMRVTESERDRKTYKKVELGVERERLEKDDDWGAGNAGLEFENFDLC